MSQPAVVQITPGAPGEPWTASVNGAPFPLVSCAVEQGGTRPVVSLILDAESVQIGTPPASPAAPAEKAPSMWGKPGPDPREAIPGWTPEAPVVEGGLGVQA